MELITAHLSRWGLCYKFLCSIFSKGTQSFDFIKRKVIRKLSYKFKCISQINGCLIMFFGNSRVRFLKISWLDCGQCGKNQYKKKEHNQHSSVFSVKITLILFKCHRSIDNSNNFYLLILS